MKKQTIILLAGILCTAMLFSQNEIKNREWTIVESFDIPGKASGLAYDGQYLYFGIYGANGDQFYRFDPETGAATLMFNHPEIGDSFGMTYDGENLWVINQPSGSSNPALATEVDFSGNTLSTITLPDHYMSGIAWDEGDFWVCTYYPDPGQVYQIDDGGNILNQFSPPVGSQIWDVCTQDEFLWFTDYNADMVYKTDRSGTLVEQHDVENIKPAGIVYDGIYLWYVDGPLSSPGKLYKIDLGGSGTPVINVPTTAHNFGNVSIGDSAIWNISVSNTGTADLSIENLIIQNAVPIFTWETFPQTLEPGNSTELEIIFKPTEVGPLSTIITLESSDPVSPEVEIELSGEAILSGPAIRILDDTHDFGSVRSGAFTRWNLFVESIGDENLIIESIVSTSEYFSVDENIQFPVSIAPLAAENFGLWFHPVENTNYAETLILTCNDPLYPTVEITLSGQGLSQNYPIGEQMWYYQINTSWDNSPKAIGSLPDISGDGVNEVIVASEDNFVRCFNGNSDGIADVLWEQEIYSGNVYQSEALSFLNDINGDSYQEVVVGTTGADRSVTAFSGKTGEQLWKFHTNMWGGGGWVYEVDATRDFNQDGFQDVLACAGNDAQGTGPNRIFCINGSNGTLLWDYYLNGPGFAVMAIDDVNGDNIPEALAGASNENESQGKTVVIDGSTGNEIWTSMNSGTSVWGLVQLDDINGDDIKDVASGEFTSADYKAYDATNGTILFEGSVGGGYGIITELIRLDDVNDDGYADFSVASNSTNCVVINGYEGGALWLTPLADQASKVNRIPDISGDAINDVVVGTLYQDNYVYFLDGVNGDILKSIGYGEPIDALSAIPDINGDVSWEVVAGGREGKVTCFSGGINAYTALPENSTQNQKINISASPNPITDFCRISIKSDLEFTGNLSVMSAGGRMIKNFGRIKTGAGEREFLWNGKNESGNISSQGLYFVVFATGEYSKVLKVIKQ